MDYKTHNAMSTLQDLLLVGQQNDLSFKYANNGSRLTRLFGAAAAAAAAVAMVQQHTPAASATVIDGGHRTISQIGGSEGEDDDLDMRSEEEHEHITLSDVENVTEQTVTPLPKKVKLSFSVESILSDEIGRNNVDPRKRPASARMPARWSNANSPTTTDDEKIVVHSAAEAIDMSLPVYRPLPLRYVKTSAPTSPSNVPAAITTSGTYRYFFLFNFLRNLR